jgi:hypothetical protein
MDDAVAKTNARWKKGLLVFFVASLWLFYFTTAVWFAVESKPTEAVVLKRVERSILRKGSWAQLEVAYTDADGKPALATIHWHVTPPPPGVKIPIWRADRGLTKAGPASLAETFFIETLFGYVALAMGMILLVAFGFAKWKDPLRKRLQRKP